jgi:hypothetical protein
MKLEILKETPIKKETLPRVVNRIFSICKTDPHFKLKEEMKTVEGKIGNLKNKVDKQLKLLEQSKKLQEEVRKRIALIKADNESRQTELLEDLGSEL